MPGNLLIGIDVGGTNTDSVLLDPSCLGQDQGVIDYHKVATTADVSDGISQSLERLFVGSKHSYQEKDVLAITIGTTHFINAVIEQDTARLQKVAVLRICGPYSKGSYAFSDFPPPLTSILRGPIGYVDGGNRVDGDKIRDLDEKAVIQFANAVKEANIQAIAIVGIFSNISSEHELRSAELIRHVIPDANVVISSEVSGIGLLARENATILNAAIMSFANRIITSFTRSVRQRGFRCPILLTQNDGTLLTVEEARKIPIRTFSSGPTNSMRGASFLCSGEQSIAGTSVMVVDIGGTTTDVGLLLPSGFPRQVSSHSVVGGVRMNFSMPHVESIGLGGGSIVSVTDSRSVSVGPESVGSDIASRGMIFGGKTLTATDMIVMSGARGDTQAFDIGSADPSFVESLITPDLMTKFQKSVKEKIDTVIDRMRTSPDPLPVVLVGGGSFISPLELDGASIVLRPPFYQVANAIGAAMGKLSASIHRIEHLHHIQDKDFIIERLMKQISKEIVSKGALEDSVKVVDIAHEPVPYVDRTYSFAIKVVGDVDYDRVKLAFEGKESVKNDEEDFTASKEKHSAVLKQSKNAQDVSGETQVDHLKYQPTITDDKEWLISETDLDYICVGTYILGCGGGGSPYPSYLELRNMIRNGSTVRVISIDTARKRSNNEGKFISVGYMGSPTVSDEQLPGEELMDASLAMFKYIECEKADGVLAFEIGGGNGFTAMYCGSSAKLDLPVVDCDLMGRAYPTHNQTTVCALTGGHFWDVVSISDGNRNKFLITGAQSDELVERMARAALAQIGCHVGAVNTPMSSKQLDQMTVHNSLSQAWRIGRAVFIGRQKMEIDKLPKYILDSLGGEGKVGRQIFQGKIVRVEKKLHMGHVYGEVQIEDDNQNCLKIPFKNENIVAELRLKGSNHWEVVTSVPDLISVCYSDSGEACGTPDYRYGIMVFVLAIAPSKLWTSSDRALAVGGPKGFGPIFEGIRYTPVGIYSEPLSVIDEYCMA